MLLLISFGSNRSVPAFAAVALLGSSEVVLEPKP